MNNKEIDNHIKKSRKWGTIISSMGVLFMVGSMIAFMINHSYKNDEIKEAIAVKDSIISVVADTIKKMSDSSNKDVVMIDSKAKNMNYTNVRGKKIYEMTFKLKRKYIKKDIVEVRYFFNNPTFSEKMKVSTNRKKGFQIKYLGYGCIDTVKVYIVHKNNKIDSLIYKMCDEIKFDMESIKN